MYDGDYSNYYDEPSREERDKARKRGCFVAIGYLIVLAVLLWLVLR